MKTLLVVFISFLMTAATVMAQNKNVVSAFNYLKYGELDNAKDAIDQATLNEQTSTMSKTWFYRGNVYLQLFATKEEKYKKLHPDPLMEAYSSYTKAYEYDTKKIEIAELDQAYRSLIPPLFAKGAEEYNNKAFDKSVANFERCIDIYRRFKIVDTLSYFNAGLSAEKAKMTDKAIQFYNKCIEMNYGGAKVFANIADIYRNSGNEEMALQTISKGRAKYPNDQDLITTETNFYLKKEDYDKALGNLDLAIQNDPKNASFYFARGSIYDQKKEIAKAEFDYKNAIEFNPDYFDAHYNLGALHFNSGAEIYNQANNLPLNELKKAEELRKQAQEKFKMALPYLEKAHQLNPRDKQTMQSLKQLYARTGQNEKFKEMNEKLNN